MEQAITGIHHVTAIAADPQRNVDFYAGVLGLRLVKQTVNFDDSSTYHLYYGDESGRPGTILTFFPWPGAARGRSGAGQTGATSFSAPAGALDYWTERLAEQGVTVTGPAERFGEQVISFIDPDGLPLELIATGDDSRTGWRAGPIPAEYAIRGLHGVTLWEEDPARTAALLTETLGFRPINQEDARSRYALGDGSPGSLVDVLSAPHASRGLTGAGTVHHVAWRTRDDAQQALWHQTLADRGHHVSPIMDRQYFRSLYFREPGGVLFEIATDPPGFSVDESLDELGTHLRLPPQYESQRALIERVLPPLRLPGQEAV